MNVLTCLFISNQLVQNTNQTKMILLLFSPKIVGVVSGYVVQLAQIWQLIYDFEELYNYIYFVSTILF